MKYYFLSNLKCAVKINGKFLGIASNNLSFINILSEDNFVEFIPLKSEFSPLHFYITPRAKSTQNIAIIDLYGDFLLVPTFEASPTFKLEKLLFKEFKERGVFVNLFYDNGLKLYIQTRDEFFVFSPKIPCFTRNAHAFICGDYLAVIINGESVHIYIFDLSSNIRLHACFACNSYSQNGNELLITYRPNTLTRLTIATRFNFENGDSERTISRGRAVESLPQPIIPLAFLQEVKEGAPFCDFLCDSLKQKASLINKFFGDFAFSIPTNNFGEVYIISLCAQKATFHFKNGLISNFIME